MTFRILAVPKTNIRCLSSVPVAARWRLHGAVSPPPRISETGRDVMIGRRHVFRSPFSFARKTPLKYQDQREKQNEKTENIDNDFKVNFVFRLPPPLPKRNPTLAAVVVPNVLSEEIPVTFSPEERGSFPRPITEKINHFYNFNLFFII